MRFEISACDPNTGTVLDEDFNWHLEGAIVSPLRKTFELRKPAEEFASEIHKRRADVEIWINDLKTQNAEMLFDGFRTRFQIYCDILYRGLLDIRSASAESNTERCFAQADHLHNMPNLLTNQGDEKLHDFYWRCMRPDYDMPDREDWPRIFDSLWKELEIANHRVKKKQS